MKANVQERDNRPKINNNEEFTRSTVDHEGKSL